MNGISITGSPKCMEIIAGKRIVGRITALADSNNQEVIKGYYVADLEKGVNIHRKPCDTLNQAKALAEYYFNKE